MRLIITDWFSPDTALGNSLRPRSYQYLVQFDVSVSGEEAAESFSVVVASADNKAEVLSRRDPLLVFPMFEWPLVLSSIEKSLRKIEEQNPDHWPSELNKYFSWEYENLGS